MYMLLCFLSVLVLLGLFLLWFYCRKLFFSTLEMEEHIDAITCQIVEQQLTLEKLLEMTTSSFEGAHKTLSGVSFDLLESIPHTRSAGKAARDIHDNAANSIYASMRLVGKSLSAVHAELNLRRRRKRDTGTD